MSKRVAMYGTGKVKAPVKQRYWHTRKDGVRQRYWQTKARSYKKVETKGRYEFKGKGRDLLKAVVLGHTYLPKGYVDVSAEEFLEDPEEYGQEGEWIEKDIES